MQLSPSKDRGVTQEDQKQHFQCSALVLILPRGPAVQDVSCLLCIWPALHCHSCLQVVFRQGLVEVNEWGGWAKEGVIRNSSASNIGVE